MLEHQRQRFGEARGGRDILRAVNCTFRSYSTRSIQACPSSTSASVFVRPSTSSSASKTIPTRVHQCKLRRLVIAVEDYPRRHPVTFTGQNSSGYRDARRQQLAQASSGEGNIMTFLANESNDEAE